MKEPALQDWACRLLEDQLERLGELRNANPRDAAFKLWRQTTLTVIQRVWPGNLQRSEKFRRIPFTAPSAKPTRAQVKEYFERGCEEASSYLRGLVHEIQAGALDPDTAIEARPEKPLAESADRASIAEMLSAPLPGEVRPTPPAPAPFAPLPPDPSPPRAPSAPAAKAPPAKTPPRKPEGQALKEMLGFGEPAAAPPAPPPPVGSRPPLEDPHAPPRPVPAFSDAKDDLLGSSPVFQATPRPVPSASPTPAPPEPIARNAPRAPIATTKQPARSEPRPTQGHPVAAALSALAGEVAELGVPDGRRAGTRAALSDLARQIDERTASWESLRDAFHLVLEYPALARRVIPLLIPFLELE